MTTIILATKYLIRFELITKDCKSEDLGCIVRTPIMSDEDNGGAKGGEQDGSDFGVLTRRYVKTENLYVQYRDEGHVVNPKFISRFSLEDVDSLSLDELERLLIALRIRPFNRKHYFVHLLTTTQDIVPFHCQS